MPTAQPQDGCTLGDLRLAMEVGFTRIDGKLDHFVEHINRTDKELKDLRQRVTTLERKVYTASGAAALIGMGLPYVVQAMGG